MPTVRDDDLLPGRRPLPNTRHNSHFSLPLQRNLYKEDVLATSSRSPCFPRRLCRRLCPANGIWCPTKYKPRLEPKDGR